MSLLISKDQDSVLQKASIIIPGVELIGIINKRGRMMNWVGPKGLEMPRDKKEMFLMKIALRTIMQKDFDEDLDSVKYSVTQRGHRKFLSIPTFDDNPVLVVTKDDFAHEELIESIIQALNYSDRFLDEEFSKGGNA